MDLKCGIVLVVLVGMALAENANSRQGNFSPLMDRSQCDQWPIL